MIDDLNHDYDQRTENCFETFIVSVEAGKRKLMADIGSVVDKHLLEMLDQITLETMLSEIGTAVIRSSGEERKINVSVTFL